MRFYLYFSYFSCLSIASRRSLFLENKIILVYGGFQSKEKLWCFVLSYLSVNERRKTVAHAKLIAQQVKECTIRKLDLLERSFELEKQKILDEELEAKNNADLVALNSRIDELNR